MTDFEGAVKKVADALHAAARKSGEILENTKISYNISTEKDKIVKLQSKIGEKFYKIYKNGGSVPESILEDMEAIDAIEETIRALEKTIADTKPYKYCSDCGAKLDLSDIYCAKCGAKQHNVEPAKEEACCCDDDDGDDEHDGDTCCDDDDECCDSKDGSEECCDDKNCCE